LDFNAYRIGRKKSDDGEDGFMICFSSLMILLLTFMILMVTLAQIKEPRFRKAIGSVKGAFAFLPYTGGDSPLGNGSPGVLPEEVPGVAEPEEAEEPGAYELAVQQIREKANLPDMGGLEIEENQMGLTIRVSDALIFERGRADLRAGFLPVLDLIAEAIKTRPGRVSVVGHTCDLPIATREFPSNWELSIVRAVSVVHFLRDRGVAPESLYAYGLADQGALVTNDGEENRRKNRRVEIFVANRAKQPRSHGSRAGPDQEAYGNPEAAQVHETAPG
jgi:chemotaxis protein MotB